MANGGIIGPVQTVTPASCAPAQVTSFKLQELLQQQQQLA